MTNLSHSIYAAAILFNPSRRKAYFNNQWIREGIEAQKEQMLITVRKTWEKEYKLNITEEEKDEEATRRRRRPDFLDKYLHKPQFQAKGDAFQSYIAGAPIFYNEADLDLLSW